MPNLREKLQQLPSKPGVYQFFNGKGELLYIGKAKNLQKRVTSYWQKSQPSPWTQLLVEQIADVKVTEVTSELEALMLENSLIKSLRPIYNLRLKDDKTFPFIRVSNEAFPTFTITRKVRNDKAKYLGPYLSTTYLRSLLKLVRELYGVKTASEKSYELRSSVPAQIGLGTRNLGDKEAYAQQVMQAIQFITSPQPQMERIIRESMLQAAREERFELAAALRNRLAALEHLRDEQSLFGTSLTSRDYIGIAQAGKLTSVYILSERDGKITHNKDFIFELFSGQDRSELTQSIVTYLYINGLSLPKEIVLRDQPNEADSLQQLLREQSGRNIRLWSPQRGEAVKRLATAEDNAAYQLKLESLKKSRREHGLADLAKVLGLPVIPKRIEAFDISNLGPTNIVGASIVFIEGQPAKSEYRKYKIQTPEGQDDFASMRELVFRRLKQSNRPVPDLLLIDGGKGQLSAALEAMRLAHIEAPIVSLAKKEELLFKPGQAEPIALPRESDALLFITAIRDEVHRFVISFHRQRRRKSLLVAK